MSISLYPSTIASRTPLFRGFSRQEHSGGLPFPPARDLPDPGIKSVSPALMSGGGLPTWWLFSLRRPSSGVYGLYGRVNSNLQEGFCQGSPSWTPVACAPFLWRAPTDPLLHGGPSSTSRRLWFSLLWGRCSFPLGNALETGISPGKGKATRQPPYSRTSPRAQLHRLAVPEGCLQQHGRSDQPLGQSEGF